MKIRLLRDSRWSVGFFKQDQILEVGIGKDVSQKIGDSMVNNGYAEMLDGDVKLSATPENKAVNPSLENKEIKTDETIEKKSVNTNEFKSELIEKINSMTKKELIRYAKKNKIKIPDGFIAKTTILEKVLEYMDGGIRDEKI